MLPLPARGYDKLGVYIKTALDGNPPSQQISPVALRHMSPVQASAGSETEIYPPPTPRQPAPSSTRQKRRSPLRPAPARGGRLCVVAHSQRQG